MSRSPLVTVVQIVVSGLLVILTLQAAAAEKPRNRYLLLNEQIVAAVENARLELGSVTKDPNNPLLEEQYWSDPPREWEARFDNVYPHVMYDAAEGLYKAWHKSFVRDAASERVPIPERPTESYSSAGSGRRRGILYAVSEDGIHWVKPELGLVEFEGCTANNVVMLDFEGAVFQDPHEPDPARRYKLFGRIDRPRTQLAVAFSRDGVRWDPPIPWPEHSAAADAHNNAIWAPELERYVGITRGWANQDGRRIRTVLRTESRDFVHWSEPVEVLRGETPDAQVYSLPIFWYGNVYLGLPSILTGDSGARRDLVDTELAWSPDSKTWHRIAPGQALIPRGGNLDAYPDSDYDAGCIYASIPVITDTEFLLYYGASNHYHRDWRESSLCLARMRLDGFAGYQAEEGTVGRLETQPFLVQGGRLTVNADIGPGGALRVALRDAAGVELPGYSAEDSTVLTGQAIDARVQWGERTLADLQDQTVRLVFTWNDGRLYSLAGDLTVPPDNREKRAQVLKHLLETFRSDAPGEEPKDVPIWESWLRRTGELPPDFDQLAAAALPPDLLTFGDGRPVAQPEQWPERRKEIRAVLDRYMLGDWPPPPERLAVKYQRTKAAETETYVQQNVQLWFAPSVEAVEFAERSYSYNPGLTPDARRDRANHLAAILNVELFLPRGDGPFPAIVEIGPSNLERDLPRVERGYLVARFSRLDADYIAAVYTDYECNQLEWWAFAASRCVDLLYSRDDVDHDKIALVGHSRGGKTAMLAALMDERVDALINSHPGTAAGSYNLWRYAGEKYGGETLENSTRRFQYWNNPRMRFFIGRENKMPFDSHFLVALMAPRPVLLGTGERDHVGQAWGDQQCYLAVKEVYRLLESTDQLGFYASPGRHEVTPQMMDDHLDWLDMQFGRKPMDFPERLIYTYSFEEWQAITGEEFDAERYPERDLHDLLLLPDNSELQTREAWETKAGEVRQRIEQMIGELPAYEPIESVTVENERRFRGEWLKAQIPVREDLVAHLTWPAEREERLPVVIYLHAYLDAGGHNWSRGYGYRTSVGERLAQAGFLAIEFDQFGYASRNRGAGIEFYREHPASSALAVMIQDVRQIIDAVSLLDWVDEQRIMVAGYSLGGLVALHAAVFDSRIQAVASTCGFGSLRRDAHGNQTEGLKRYSHLRPTLPRLGLFLGHEQHVPYDFHEVLALIAPRRVFILAPQLDQDWLPEDVEICYRKAARVFELYDRRENLVFCSPHDFNRYPPEYQDRVNRWLAETPEGENDD